MVLVSAVALGALVQAGAARARIQSVADVAALSAAQSLLDGAGTHAACHLAGEVATAADADLLRCDRAPGTSVLVTVQGSAHLPILGTHPVLASARAGPPVFADP